MGFYLLPQSCQSLKGSMLSVNCFFWGREVQQRYLLRESSLFVCFSCHEGDRTLHSSAPIRVRSVNVPRRDSKDSSIRPQRSICSENSVKSWSSLFERNSQKKSRAVRTEHPKKKKNQGGRTVFINCTSSKDDSTIERLFVTRWTSTGSSGAGLLQMVVVIAGTVVALKLMW